MQVKQAKRNNLTHRPPRDTVKAVGTSSSMPIPLATVVKATELLGVAP